jgi:hypothetical protein
VGWVCGTRRRGQKSVQDLMGKPEGKGPLGRPRRRCEDEIRIDLREIGWVCNGFSRLRIGAGDGLL